MSILATSIKIRLKHLSQKNNANSIYREALDYILRMEKDKRKLIDENKRLQKQIIEGK